MRIKRQRRKLRGKYSGNCLSCAAKWSKCWYIASVDNQAEWESRLFKTVTPCADEVCFQCWDAKIRTSPKRKMHFKAELPAVAGAIALDDSSSANSPLRPAKRVGRNKRRALNEDYAYTLHDATQSPDDSKQSYDGSEEEYFIDENDDEETSDIYQQNVVLDEENAVLLLSTAFHSIPGDIDININISARYHVSEIPNYADDAAFDAMTSKKRGAPCGSCGNMKKGHVCVPLSSAESSPTISLPASPLIIPQLPIQTPSIQLQPLFQPQTGGLLPSLVVLAQPVGS